MAPASRDHATHADKEVAGPGMPRGLQSAPPAAQQRSPGVVASWPPGGPRGFPCSAVSGRKTEVSTWTASELDCRAGAKDSTLDAPSPGYRKSQTTSTRTARLLPNARSPLTQDVWALLPAAGPVIMQGTGTHTPFRKDRRKFNSLEFLVGIIKLRRER